jgi:hypothetical protein
MNAVFADPSEPRLISGGFDLYTARADKQYSLTDCISMQTVRREGLTEVLTNGRHFEREGRRTPKARPCVYGNFGILTAWAVAPVSISTSSLRSPRAHG